MCHDLDPGKLKFTNPCFGFEDSLNQARDKNKSFWKLMQQHIMDNSKYETLKTFIDSNNIDKLIGILKNL